MEVLLRWRMALHAFLLNLVRLQHPLSVLYLMTVNFSFCFVAFYTSREVQLRCLYALIALVFCVDFVFARRHCNIVLELIRWIFSDFFKILTIALCAFSVNELNEKREQRAFFSSLLAVCAIVSSPIYKHHQINAKIFKFLRDFGLWVKHLFARYIVRPLFLLWDWLKYILLLRWLTTCVFHLRSYFLSLWDWIDLRLFHPLRLFVRSVRSWLVYLFCLHWCVDLSAWFKRAIIDPACVRLSHLLDGLIYLFGCYWLKPLLKQMGNICLGLTMSGFRFLGQVSYSMAAVFYEHIFCPLIILCGDRVEQFSVYLYKVAVQPLLTICYRKYRVLEDLVLVYILGPVLKKFLGWIPERNPFDHDSDHELDEYIPDISEDGESEVPITGEEGIGGGTMTERDAADSAMHSDEEEADEFAFASSRHSFEDEKLLASGLKRIAISESDSEADEFLPVSVRKRRTK